MIDEIKLQQARRELPPASEQTRMDLEDLTRESMTSESRDRQRLYREKMRKLGNTYMHLWLSPKAMKKIEAVQKERGITKQDAAKFIIENY